MLLAWGLRGWQKINAGRNRETITTKITVPPRHCNTPESATAPTSRWTEPWVPRRETLEGKRDQGQRERGVSRHSSEGITSLHSSA